MKIKTFILTFLMMMSSPFLFGQHWTDPGDTGYNQSMSLLAQIFLDDDVQEGNYEVAAFYNDELLGVGQIVPLTGTTSNYHVHLNVQGNTTLDGIYFKFFNGTNEYVSSTEMSFTEGLKGSHSNYESINFYSVAQIGNVVYPSLQEAIDAAANGDVVTLLKDNAENVTVVQAPNVAFTIDGDEETMSGTITVNGKSAAYATAGLTIKNVNFDATNIADASIMLGVSGDNNTRYTNGVTVQDCDFTGNGQTKVAIKNYTGGCKNLTVTGGTFTGLHSLMQVKGVENLAVSGVTVSECKNGVSVGTSTNVDISDSNITATGYGVRADGGAYTMTLTNNNISAELPVVVRKAAEFAYNLTIAGDNNFTAKQQGNNPKGYQVVFTTGDDGTYLAPTTGQFVLSVPENFNVYPVYVAQVGNLKYTSVDAALTAAQTGDVVQIFAGTYNQALNINKAITVQGERNDQNENLVNITGKLNITANNATAKNLNVDNGNGNGAYINAEDVTVDGCTVVGGNGFRSCYTKGLVTFKNSTITGSTYGIHFDGSAGGEIVIDNCVITGWTSFAKTITKVTMKDTSFEEGNYNYIRFYQQNVDIDGCTFNENMAIDIAIDGNTTTIDGCTFTNGNIEDLFEDKDIVNSTIIVDGNTLKREASIGNTYYETLAEALEAVKDMSGEVTINLLSDATLDITAWQDLAIGGENTTKIIIDGENGENDFTLTFNKKNSDWNHIATSKDNATDLVLQNIKITDSGYNNGPWNRYDINFACDVELNNVVSTKALAFKAGAKLNNVTIDENGDNYAIWIQPNGQNVAIDGLVINSAGRGIKVDEQYVTAQNVNLSVANATFTTVKKAAIMVKSAANTVITVGEDVNISGVYADQTNIAWVDEDAAAHYGKVTVTGGTLGQENMPSFVAALMNGDKIEGYYETLPKAITAQTGNEIVKVLKDATGAGAKINKNITIDFGGYTYTFNEGVGSGDLTSNGFQLLQGNTVVLKNGTLKVADADASEFYILVQNYTDLKVENMTLDGTNLDKWSKVENNWDSYTLSNNSGEVNIINTKIYANDEGVNAFAFDVDNNANYTSKPVVNVSGENTLVRGNVEVDLPDNLNISGGKFTVEIEEAWCANGFIPKDNGDGTWTVKVGQYVARIGETGYEELDAAFAAAQNDDEVKILVAGTYALKTSGKNITITGAVDGVVFDNIGAKNMGGANVTFNHVTFDYYPNVNYTGLQHSGNLVYNNCIINGQVFLYGTSEEFNGCTFNQNSADAYNVWTYGAKEVAFNECTFNSVGKSVLIYSESELITNDVTVTDCDFIASAQVEGKAAIEMDSSLQGEINLTIDAATTETGFDNGNVSGNSLWNNKKGNATEANNDITVVVNGVTVLAPLPLVAQIGDVKYTSLQTAIDAATSDQTVIVISDVELENTLTVAAGKVVTLDLNGKTVSMNDDSAATAALLKNNGNLTINDSSAEKNGKLAFNSTTPSATNAYASNTISNHGTIKILGGTIENTTVGGACYALDNYAGSTATIEGGKLTAKKTTVRIFNWTNGVASKATLNVSGGEIYSEDGYGININSGNAPYVDLNISGGVITTDDTDYDLAVYVVNKNNAENFNVNIAGGTFNGDVAINGTATQTMKPGAVKVSGGTFNGNYGVFSYAEDAVAVPVISITGGTFASNYAEIYSYDDGFKFVFNNTTHMYGLQEFSDLEISNLNELIAFRNAVNAGNDFAGKVVTVTADIDMSSETNWIPIGTSENPFKGIFDGGGDNFTISNLKVNAPETSNVGLFGVVKGGATVKNITINNATVKGKSNVAAIAGNLHSSTMDNCHVTGLVQIDGNYKVGGLIGGAYSNVRNSSLIAYNNSYVKGTHVEANLEGDNVGGITGYNGEGTYTYSNNTVKNVTISGTRKVGGILGFIFEDAKVEGSVVENVTIESTSTSEYANANVGKMSIGGIIGQYQKHGKSDGYVNSSFVKNVTFLNSSGLNFQVGPLVGGTRGNADFVPSATVTSEGNLVYMSTITGSNNLFLMNAVAKIGETEYYTLFDAVAAAQGETTTITLISNTSEEFAINNTETAITLDLNGKELTGAILPSNAKLTVKNGTIVNEKPSVSAIEINVGSLTLNEDVTIESARHAVRIDGAVIAEVNGGEYKLISSNGVTQHAFNISGNANVTINGGKFVGPAGTASDSGSAVNLKSGATVTINGGDFSGGKNHTLSAAGTLIVKGGTFDQDPSAYVAPGYKAEKTGNVWTVKLMTMEIFLTAAGTVTTADATDAVYSLMFTITDEVNKEVSVKIGSMKPANNSNARLVIPETVEFDGINEAFEVTAIEDNAFNSCRNFVGDLTLPRYVRTIGDRSFNTCHYITNPEHPKGKLTLNEGLTSIGSQAFTNSYFTDGLSIPSSVTMIEPNAFQYARINGALTINSDVECALAFNSSEFTKVEIAEGVEEICANAFNGMVNVTEVVLPSTLKEIGLAAFGSDNAIETIWSNAAVAPTIIWQSNIESNKHPFTQTVRNNAVVLVTTNYKNYTEAEKWKEFANIYGLYPIQKTGYSLLVKVNDNVCSVEIGDKPHQNDRIELELPRTIEYYGTERAVTSIAKGGFRSCPFFGILTIPGNIETIADNAFNTCMQFDGLVIEEGVKTIGNGSFSMCYGVDYISFPSTLESIGQNAFNVVYMENGGRIVSFAANPPTAYKHIYNQGINPVNPSFPQNLRNNAILYVFEESLDKYKSATGWEFRDVRPIEAKIGETYYLTLNEAIAAATSGQTITLLADVEAADGTPVLIPEGVTLDINTHNVTANIYGTVKTSGGLWTTVTVPGFNSRKMLGNGAIYNTTNATVANSATKVEMLAGSIVLNPNPETEWWTLPNQNLSIASGALFEVPANIKFTVREDTHVVVDGTLTVNGVVYLQMGATVKAAAGLNILTDVEGYMVSYDENGVYSVVQAIYTQTTQLIEGWNWFSSYVETDLEALQTALGTNGVQIKDNELFTDYYVDPGVWYGKLTSISANTNMYLVKMKESTTISISGKLVDLNSIEITLYPGWNWIAYPCNTPTEINVALSNLTPAVGDKIKTDDPFADYYQTEQGGIWYGSLNQLTPGAGYLYYNSTDQIKKFKYAVSSKSELRANVTTDNNHWIPSAGQYANNMTMTAMVNVEGNYEIAAFVNGEVRGSARPIYVEALDSYIYFLTIHGDEVEEMSFRLYDLDTDVECNLSDRMNYSNDAIVGSLTEPYMFNLEMLGIGENSAESFNIYPNPTTTNAEINLNATCDKVEVFNALGVKIAEYSNVDSIDAVETAGIYVIRVTNNNNVQHCRLIVK